MNKAGIFCTAMAIVFAIAAVSFHHETNANRNKIIEARLIALEAEKCSLKRHAVEQAFDKAVVRGLEKCLLVPESRPEVHNIIVATEISIALQKVSDNSEQINFENSRIEFIRANSKSFVLTGEETIAKYYFTGGVNGVEQIKAEITCGKTKTEFKILKGFHLGVTG